MCKTCVVAKEEGVKAKIRLETVEANRPAEVLALEIIV